MPVNYTTPSPETLFPVAGIRLGLAEAGIRKLDRRDLTLVALDTGCTVAGEFTQNRFCAAPVQISREHLASGQALRQARTVHWTVCSRKTSFAQRRFCFAAVTSNPAARFVRWSSIPVLPMRGQASPACRPRRKLAIQSDGLWALTPVRCCPSRLA